MSASSMTAEHQLAGFIAKFTPPMQDRIRSCRTRLERKFPHAVKLVYDNYNFLVIGFGPSLRPSEAIFSLAAQRSGVALCFLQQGSRLPDPYRLLRGNGRLARNLPLMAAEDLERPEIDQLLDAADRLAAVPMALSIGSQLVIRSVSAKQRPRR